MPEARRHRALGGLLLATTLLGGCGALAELGLISPPLGQDGSDPAWLLAGPAIGASPAPWLEFCRRDPRADCLRPPREVELTEARWQMLQTVQAEVNAGFLQLPEPPGQDEWRIMSPGEAGDCEDFALTKRDRLIAAGFPAGALHIGICFNHDQSLIDGETHAVLTVDTDQGTWVLGNLWDGVRPWRDSECRDWVMRSGGPGWRWTREGVRVPLQGLRTGERS